MEIYILRHGIAEEGVPGQPDEDRALTPEGKKKLRGVLRAAQAAGIQPALMMTSSYKRAMQTVELAAEIFKYKGDILPTEALEPGSRPTVVWDEIREHKDETSILLAGHEPLFSSLTAHLLGCSNLQVDFKKGALACVEIYQFGPAPHGILKWMLTAKLAGG